MANEVIYTLQCAEGKYYVGKTRADRMYERFHEHVSGRGSAWTRMYSPRCILRFVPCTDPLQEDFEVEKCMRDHGIDNVRGGRYVQVSLPADRLAELNHKFGHSSGRCFRCNGFGHYGNSCPVKICDRCGRHGHMSQGCYANTHVDGHSLEESEDSIDEETCTRCGRQGHYHTGCYAKTDVGGHAIPDAHAPRKRNHFSDTNEVTVRRVRRNRFSV
jgi:predicted GIY-YIG superfamily endonuclease